MKIRLLVDVMGRRCDHTIISYYLIPVVDNTHARKYICFRCFTQLILSKEQENLSQVSYAKDEHAHDK